MYGTIIACAVACCGGFSQSHNGFDHRHYQVSRGVERPGDIDRQRDDDLDSKFGYGSVGASVEYGDELQDMVCTDGDCVPIDLFI
jgi:hypothetical protein